MLVLWRMAALLLVCRLDTASVTANFRLSSPFGWRCLAGACVRQEKTALGSSSLRPFSTCKLTCGKHASLWPIPTNYTKISKETEFFLLERVNLTLARVSSPRVEELTKAAFRIFMDNLRKMKEDENSIRSNFSIGADFEQFYSSKTINHRVLVDITVLRGDTELSVHTPEQYSLGITTTDVDNNSFNGSVSQGLNGERITRVTIIGTTFFGIRHGLETLGQLIAFNEETNDYEIVSTAAIIDSPVYPYRGLLLDTARNFFPVSSIKRTLDAMAANKMNTFHWHISDSQSFPLMLKSLPKMAYYGAFSSQKIYTAEDVKDLVAYAKVRGIRVVPEVDAPAHVGNGWQWGPKEGLGELLACFNKRPWTSYCVGPPCGQLNLANPNIYMVLEKIYKEYMDLFGQLELFHFGGDEINLNCWNSTKEITDMMVASGLGLDAAAYYSQWAAFQEKSFNLLEQARETNVPVTGIIWSSKLTDKAHVEQHLPKNKYIIQVWAPTGDEIVKDLLTKGYRIILSNSDVWYLDCGYSSWVSGGLNWCAPYKSWQQVYSHRPSVVVRRAMGESSAPGQVLGGEVAAWSEQIDDVSLDNKVWPRAAAFAERMWSDPSRGWRAAENRLVHHRQRMVARGIMADRIKPEWCHQHDSLCTDLG